MPNDSSHSRESVSFLASSRRQDEETATIEHDEPETVLDDIRKRRLLGQLDLDSLLNDDERKRLVVELTALYKHGHLTDVLTELERVMSLYPHDLTLQGTLVDFFLDHGDLVRGVDMLFRMVTSHFERANLGAARRCLQRVKALDPDNRRLLSYERMLD